MSYGKSFYEKKIKYLDYFEGQTRLGGGGFAKLEVREGNLRVDMTVTGLHATDTFTRDVALCGKGRERVAGRIEIAKGKGRYLQQWQDLEDIGGTGISYKELQGIRIPLGTGREVSCRWQIGETGEDMREGNKMEGGRQTEDRTDERWQAGSDIEERRYEGSEAGGERYDGSEEGEQRDGGMEMEKEPVARGPSERELPERGPSERGLPERGLSERERAAVNRWKIEDDTEDGAVSRESEMKAMEGGRGEIAGASDRGEILYSRGGYAADEETKSRENGAYAMDSSRPGGYMAEEGGKPHGKDTYGTDESRPGGYAAEDGIWVHDYDRHGSIAEQMFGNRSSYGREKTIEGSGNGGRRAVESRTGKEGRRSFESGNRYETRRDIESANRYEDRRGAESGNRYGDRRGAESGNRYEDRRGAESREEYSDREGMESKVGFGGRTATESGGDHRQGKRPMEKQMKPMEDKWPQLWSIYPHIRPFQDEREYLSIGPADFVLFPASSYRSVNNSFLLHGYYNYKHLILARVEKRGEAFYYIGVPGNFYEREKQVAIMFGFESFECAEEPAQAGDFGYYMMRTEL